MVEFSALALARRSYSPGGPNPSDRPMLLLRPGPVKLELTFKTERSKWMPVGLILSRGLSFGLR